jgi:hypothetical protein
VASVYDVAATGAGVSFVYGPPDVVLEYVLYPTTAEVLAVQDNAAE